MSAAKRLHERSEEALEVTALTLFRNVTHWRTGERFTLAIEDGVVVPAPERPGAHARVHDARGAVVAPGLVDLHVHLREPGQSAKETIETGTRAAAAGGFTSIACMPNTDPVVDTPAWVEWIQRRAESAANCNVLPIAAVTVGQRGEQLAPLEALARAGAVAFSDDGRPVTSAAMMRRALEYARPTGLPIICHEEDPTLKGDGVMHEGFTATRLGLRGIPGAAESVMCRRDADLAELDRRPRSLRASFIQRLIRCAPRREETRARGEWGDVSALLGAHGRGGGRLRHARQDEPAADARSSTARRASPRSSTARSIASRRITRRTRRMRSRARSPTRRSGIVGLETALALTLTHLVLPGHIKMVRAIELWTDAPRRLFGPARGLGRGGLAGRSRDLRPAGRVDGGPEAFHSKGRNTPFAGWRLKGRVLATLLSGRFTHVASDVHFERPSAESNPHVGAR
jgi:dihydroorotase